MSFELIHKNAEDLARAINNALGDRKSDIIALGAYIENNFGFSLEIKFVDINKSGLVFLHPKTNKYQIYINKYESRERQKFTLCHEIGHIIRDCQLKCEFCIEEEFYNRKEQERFCNRFAAAFLMPRDLFTVIWNSVIFEHIDMKITHIASRLKVSIRAARNRAVDLKLI